jgi:putative endonuclease
MKKTAKSIGNEGEKIALKFLKSKKYIIHTTNYSNRYGEIDIIAEKDGVVAFVEVKTRKNSKFGRPSDFVTPSKQQRIVSAAQYYVYYNGITEKLRFDIIEVLTGDDPDNPQYYVNHIEDAFGVDN